MNDNARNKLKYKRDSISSGIPLHIHVPYKNSITSSPPLYYPSNSNTVFPPPPPELEKSPNLGLKINKSKKKNIETGTPLNPEEMIQMHSPIYLNTSAAATILHPEATTTTMELSGEGYNNWNNIDNWNKVENLRTLFSWITISALNIECLDEAIKRYRKFIAYGTILGLLFSTASGTISATRINDHSNAGNINLILSALFTMLSFTIAIYTGILKILQIQERLENFIKIKQEWILFSASISSEMQLPIHLRKPVLGIISIYKNKFLDLLKIDSEVPEFIKNDIIEKIKKKEEEKYKNEKWEDLKYSEASSLSDVIIEIGSRELKRLVTELDASIQDAIIKKNNSIEYENEVYSNTKTIIDGTVYSDDDNNSVIHTYRTMDSSSDSFRKHILKTEEDEIKKLKREIENIYKQFSIINTNVNANIGASGGGGSHLPVSPLLSAKNIYDKKFDGDGTSTSQKKDDDNSSVASLCKQMLDRKYSAASIVKEIRTSTPTIRLSIANVDTTFQQNNSDHTNGSSYSSNIAQNQDNVLYELEKNSQTNTPPSINSFTFDTHKSASL